METLHMYNSATRGLVSFSPLCPPYVGMYLCGPTVYGPAHLGHARSAITADVVVRYLRYLGYQVCFVRNITDVGHLVNDADEGEDKVVKQAQVARVHPMEVAQKYAYGYRGNMLALNVLPPSIEPCATGHIVEQIGLVEKLLKRGFAYVVNGSVYFDLVAFQKKYAYGVLSGHNRDASVSGTRFLHHVGEKRHVDDFALWKRADASHVMRWPSPWGEGFPGWHIECTAMCQKYLGDVVDIYAGGLDLLFPHHDCSVAQSVGVTGVAPARYWLHNNLVMIHGEKMSKSAGNFISLDACFSGDHPLLERGYGPMVVRFFMLQAHYRNPIDFSDQALQAARKGYYKLVNGLKVLCEDIGVEGVTWDVVPEIVDRLREDCRGCMLAMNEDFNTAKLLAQLFKLRSWIYQIYNGDVALGSLGCDGWQLLYETYTVFLGDVLGLKEEVEIDGKGLIGALLEQYACAKKEKNYAQVDVIRRVLQQHKILVHDGPGGLVGRMVFDDIWFMGVFCLGSIILVVLKTYIFNIRMNMEKTLAIIKPSAFKTGLSGAMIDQIEKAGFTIDVIVSIRMSLELVKEFYDVHVARPFYDDLCAYMSSGTVLVMVLEKDNAVEDFRTLIGATDPAKAAPNTLRSQFGTSIDYNAIHGSDSLETASREIDFFFGGKQGCCQKKCDGCCGC